MINFLYQSYGNSAEHIAVGIFGNSKSDIEIEYNNIYNFGGTNSELKWLSDKLAYYLTTKGKLKQSISDKFETLLTRKNLTSKGSVLNLEKAIETLTNIKIAKFKKETFLTSNI